MLLYPRRPTQGWFYVAVWCKDGQWMPYRGYLPPYVCQGGQLSAKDLGAGVMSSKELLDSMRNDIPGEVWCESENEASSDRVGNRFHPYR